MRELEGAKLSAWTTEDEGWCLHFPPGGTAVKTVELRVVGRDFLELVMPNGERVFVPYAAIKRVTIARKP